MSNKPKIKGAKPLLALEANNEFAMLSITDTTKAFELLYECLCGEMTKASMCIMMAVERLRQCEPAKYQSYLNHIHSALMRGSSDMFTN